MVVKSDEDVDGYGDGYGDGDRRNPPSRLYNLPSPFPPNLSLVLRLPVSYLISPNTIIVLDKVVISSIPPNPPYYITIIPIIASDKDIHPNSVLVLIIVLDKALALAPIGSYA